MLTRVSIDLDGDHELFFVTGGAAPVLGIKYWDPVSEEFVEAEIDVAKFIDFAKLVKPNQGES